ncbi:MAG: 4-hydroxythreonine-4-phosphate dehydrogenase PdxA [Deltaproteobacteria bacterium]|nr:4-hydroxythreonine-4-phosphate dehydrogenase PdxA [Deltaproteobacteria bacterium]
MSPERPLVAISLGDPCGIGCEVTLRALLHPEVQASLRPLVFGDAFLWRRAEEALARRLDPASLGGALREVTSLAPGDAPLGGASPASDRAQKAYLEAATASVLAGEARALCTAPITKAAAARAGFHHPGQTEYLAEAAGVEQVTMMLAGPRLKVALVTTHLALAEVSGALEEATVIATVRRTAAALRDWFGVAELKIAVCGLNPHAGEGGRFGREELELLGPAVEKMKAEGLPVEGPKAADAALAQAAMGAYSAVVAMYHDQGLTAAKAVDQAESVNLTLGLPFVRSSPDHGSALDIAGRFAADEGSMVAALLQAARLSA